MELPNTSSQVVELNPSCSGQAHPNWDGLQSCKMQMLTFYDVIINRGTFLQVKIQQLLSIKIFRLYQTKKKTIEKVLLEQLVSTYYLVYIYNNCCFRKYSTDKAKLNAVTYSI